MQFEQLLNAAGNGINQVSVLVRDTAATSIVNVLKKKYKIKITLEQAYDLQRAAGVAPF